MLRKKDEQILNEGQIRALYPSLSFGINTYGELGWEPYSPPPVPYVAPPLVVSPRQIRQALSSIGMREAVESAVAAGDQNLKDWWQYATAFEEDHPLVVEMATGLSLDQEALHNLFALAATL